MTVSPIRWQLPGCGDRCRRRSHDPEAHEEYGYRRAPADRQTTIVRTGTLIVDLHRGTIHVDGVEVHVSGREWEVLAYLAERVGRNCPSREIAKAIWGGLLPVRDEQNINTVINRLRQRLGAAAVLIRTPHHGLRRLDLVDPT